MGRDRNKGEYLIQGPSGKNTFVEVKSPGWEGELSDEERKGGRLRQEKYLAFEGRPVAPWKAIQFAADKAYKKFATDIPNLLIVADDLFLMPYGQDKIRFEKAADGRCGRLKLEYGSGVVALERIEPPPGRVMSMAIYNKQGVELRLPDDDVMPPFPFRVPDRWRGALP